MKSKKRAAGILMPVFSLPSKYGIGTFGAGACEFIDFLAASGQRYWQLLPLNPTSYGDSPYQSPASFAGNPYFIDPHTLADEGLITRAELSKYVKRTSRIDYAALFHERYALLRTAHGNFKEDAGYRKFLKKEGSWVYDYALFMALKVKNAYAPWYTWRDEERSYVKATAHRDEHAEEMSFWLFVQYEFDRQWHTVLNYAHKKHVQIIGDIPIYVAHDSLDVWAGTDKFLLDNDFMPTCVAGCPPDAYSATGQLWGNPIYDWEGMERDGFSWWVARIKRALRLYDILRIDHFRGFSGYYTIPYGDSDARFGKWNVAPGKALFDKIKAEIPDAHIIAEDLGFITDDVRELLSYTGLAGMKVLQFAFYDEDSEYLPRNYITDNSVVYSATQDSDTTRTWLSELDENSLGRLKKELKPKRGVSLTAAVVSATLDSRCDIAIIPFFDYLELKSERGRINKPATSEGNWSVVIPKNYAKAENIAKIKRLTQASGR